MTSVSSGAAEGSIASTRYEAFVAQLDSLVIFLAAAHDEVFQTIRRNTQAWFPESQDAQLPETFESYRATVCNAAFLLGYAYFESFLADLARDMYLRRPEMLPKEKQVSFREVLEAMSPPSALLRLLVEKEIRGVFYGSIEDVRSHFEQKLQVPWPDEPEIVVAARLRNCLMHNGGLVDERAAAASQRTLGSPIRLELAEVHAFGVMGRRLSRVLWDQAQARHLAQKLDNNLLQRTSSAKARRRSPSR